MKIKELIGELVQEDDLNDELYVRIKLNKTDAIYARIEGIAAYQKDSYKALDGTSRTTLLLEMNALTLVDP